MAANMWSVSPSPYRYTGSGAKEKGGSTSGVPECCTIRTPALSSTTMSEAGSVSAPQAANASASTGVMRGRTGLRPS